ncbi:MAG: hypothetical protein QM756_38675 [Polyangiaceae bacterium]
MMLSTAFRTPALASLSLLALLSGCSAGTGSNGGGSGGSSGGSTAANGGAQQGSGGTASGGTTGAGGAVGAGGTPGSGGASANGGSTSANGGSATGGSTSANGGNATSGGAAGSTAGGSTSGGSASGGAIGSGGGSATGACPSGAIFCADFESGTIPSQAVYFPEYQRSMISMYMSVDSTVAHGGTKSLKLPNVSNFSSMLGVTTGTSKFWTRVYIRHDVETSAVTGHDTFVAATDNNGDPNMGEFVRVGEHSCQLELNRKSDDKEILSNAVNGVSNYMCSGGITFKKDTWYCLEVYYDGPGKEVRVFVDNTESTALHVTDWGPYTYGMFKFGFENYSGTARNLWYDDVAIATTRIGCQ